jgi:hypothetical protein
MVSGESDYCSNGHEVGRGANFCGVCGQSKVAARTCANGHEVSSGQAFCGSCGSAVSETPAREDGHDVVKNRRKVFLLVGALAALVVLAAGAALMIARLYGGVSVTQQNITQLLKDGGIECDELQSLAPGQGTPQGELVQTTLVACVVQRSDGSPDNDKSFAIFVADSAEDLGKTLRVTGSCDNDVDSTLVAYGDNWLAATGAAQPDAVVTQEIASALGGEVSTSDVITERFCQLA